MTRHPKPTVVASKCLGFAACRWNGISLPDKVVDALKDYVKFETVCPEMEIGLGVPRDPIRIVNENKRLRLYQPATKKDLTDAMKNFADSFLSKLNKVDGFILKFKSPSCGLKGVKVYPKREKAGSIDTTTGFFSTAVLKKFGHLPIEDEGRLKNFNIREHFLTRLFTVANFNEISKNPTMKKLVDFHSRNKLLLMAYSQNKMRLMGKVVANHEKKSPEEVYKLYEPHLHEALSKLPRYTNSINVLQHAFGYFSKQLSKKEKAYFLDIVKKYRDKRVPLSVPLSIIRSYIARFGQDYLEMQTFFDPYPEGLTEVSDSGKGRTLE